MFPKLYENFVSDEIADMFLNAMDSNIGSFLQDGPSGKIMGFGQDNFQSSWFFKNPNTKEKIFPEIKNEIFNYINKLEKIVEQDTGKNLYLSVLWFVQTLNGGFPAHNDNEPNAIYQYEHTCILYLNDCVNGGAINFPDHDYKFYPKRGSLLSFPSNYMHEVLPVTEPRYAMPSWFTSDARYKLS